MKSNRTINLIIKTYALVLSVFSIFRVLLFLNIFNEIDLKNESLMTIVKSFLMGVRFDVVISGYILILPAFVLFVFELLKAKSNLVKKFFFYWIYIFFSIAFIIAAADIPYFSHFYERFSVGAFEWIENLSFVVSMIAQEPKYYLVIIPFVLLNIVFFILLKRIFNRKSEQENRNIYSNVIVSLLFLLIIFVGIRGRVQKKSPIRIGTAYISDNSFLNKLGLNPVFTLIRSYLDSIDPKNKTIHLMDKTLAIKEVQEFLNLEKSNFKSPIARNIIPDSILSNKPNIILVIMESMSAGKMERYGNKENLTPFMDSLANNSMYFENAYTAGKHTYNGIFSTLFSFPALYRQHAFKNIIEYDGISETLLELGYTTTYFTTHDSQFDNIGGFLKANSFQNIISQIDYPISEVKTTLGVPDDYMFRFSIKEINKLHNKNKAFFVSMMTTSDHGPYYIPEYFEAKNKDIKKQITEYADWSLRRFISLSKKEKWFDNTIFIFVADHGSPLSPTYDIALNYFHSPLIFYAPKLLEKDTIITKIASQIDIFPTIMGLLNQAYINNTLGIDLLKNNRKYTLINDDNKIGILDENYLCIMKKIDNSVQLYKYKNKEKENIAEQNTAKVKEMTDFAKSNMQVHQNLIINGNVSIQ